MQVLLQMEKMTIGELQLIVERYDRHKKSINDAYKRWANNHRELYLERRKEYNRAYYERKKQREQQNNAKVAIEELMKRIDIEVKDE